MATENEKLKTELVVIGGGGAGLATALAAAENGCRNIVAHSCSKTVFGV